MKKSHLLGFVCASVAFVSGPASAATVTDIEPNDSIATAQNIDSAFDLSFSTFIENAAGVNTSTSIMHAQISSVADVLSSWDYFSFSASAGSTVTIDVDCAAYPADSLPECSPTYDIWDSFDSVLYLYDPSGSQFVFNDDSFLSVDTGSASNFTTDSFIEVMLPTSGVWTIGVGELMGGNGPISGGSGYLLNVSVSSVPLPAAVWLFGSGLLGLVGISKRKKAA